MFLPQPMHVNKRFVYLLVNKVIVREYMYITHAYIWQYTATAVAKSLQPCPTLCNTIDGSPPGSPVPGIFQAGVLEWGAIAFSDCNIHSRINICACVQSRFSRVQIFATPWTVDHRASLSMGFSRQDYQNGLLCPPPGDLLDPGTKPVSPVTTALQVDSLLLKHTHSIK